MRSYVRILMMAVTYVWLSQFLVLTAIQYPGNDYERARLPELVDGTAPKPFVLRTMLPTAVRIAETMVPAGIRSRINDRLSDAMLFETTSARDEERPFIYTTAYVIEGLCILFWLITLRVGLTCFYNDRTILGDLLPVLGGMLLPCLFRYVHYDYDFPQLFIFSAALLLLYQRRWMILYPVLLLAALSKETAVLLVLVHGLIHRDVMSRKAWLSHGMVMLVVVAGVRILLQYLIFADNPGTGVEVYWSRNLAFLFNPANIRRTFFWIAPVGDVAVFVPTSWNVLFLLGLPVLCWRWRDKPLALRRSLWILPVLFVLTFVMGQIDEVRVYYEIVPVLFWLAGHSWLEASKMVAAPGRGIGTSS